MSQVCSEDGMEFTLRTPEGFLGRIYTHGYYDRCFYRGNGGTANVLRISGAQGYPDCGTQRVTVERPTNLTVPELPHPLYLKTEFCFFHMWTDRNARRSGFVLIIRTRYPVIGLDRWGYHLALVKTFCSFRSNFFFQKKNNALNSKS